MGDKQGLPDNNGQVLPPTDPFSVLNVLRALAQTGLGGPAGGAMAAADLAARVAQARNRGQTQNLAQNQNQGVAPAKNQGGGQPSQTSQTGSDLSFRERMAGMFGRTPPPTWTPPPPSTPAVVTPGTPQHKLTQVQEEARNNPHFRPLAPKGDPKHKTYCTVATTWQVDRVGGDTRALIDPNTGEAALVNQQYQQLSKPGSGYHPGTAEEAQDYTNRTGRPAMAIQPNLKGHGHIATVIPEMIPGIQKHTGQAPLVNNIGAKWKVETADKAFSSKLPIYYFIPDK